MVVLTNICRNFRIANQARIRHVASMLDSLLLWIPGQKLGGILVRFCAAKPSVHCRFAPCLDIGAAALQEQALASGNANVQPLRGGLTAIYTKRAQRYAVLSCSGTQD